MRKLNRLLSVIAAASLFAQQGHTQSSINDSAASCIGLEATFLGQSALVSLKPPGKSTSFFNFKVDVLEELGPGTFLVGSTTGSRPGSGGGGVHQGGGGGGTGATVVKSNIVTGIPSFGSMSFQWVGPVATQLDGNSATLVSFQSPISNGSWNDVWLNISTYMFNNSISLPYGNTTVSANQTSAKWTVNVTGWPFSGPGNWLHLGFIVTASGKTSSAPNSTTLYDDGVNHTRLKFGDGMTDFPQHVIIDGVPNSTMHISSYLIGNNSMHLDLFFPAFNDCLIYDPTTTVNLGPSGFTFAMILEISIGVTVIAGMTVFLIYKRSKAPVNDGYRLS
eukprot:TRINITY_DN3827_c0_g1_i3.p1 TRINITY_DN3827_c0_g1~~TRINITY_DN3827_c0_g1_i3.p1  ORF type:complete len:334 (-),score=60.05 TRINITY_DN3827_c0_g1_i3:55-1056(-)